MAAARAFRKSVPQERAPISVQKSRPQQPISSQQTVAKLYKRPAFLKERSPLASRGLPDLSHRSRVSEFVLTRRNWLGRGGHGQWHIQARASAALGKWRFRSFGPLEERIWSFSCIKPCCIKKKEPFSIKEGALPALGEGALSA